MFRVAIVTYTADALAELEALPRGIQPRVHRAVERLANWPGISGAKPLRGELRGSFRVRAGDYRIIFNYTASNDVITVWKIGYRGDVYD